MNKRRSMADAPTYVYRSCDGREYATIHAMQVEEKKIDASGALEGRVQY